MSDQCAICNIAEAARRVKGRADPIEVSCGLCSVMLQMCREYGTASVEAGLCAEHRKRHQDASAAAIGFRS